MEKNISKPEYATVLTEMLHIVAQSQSSCSFFENSHNLIYMYRNFIYISYVCVFTGALLVDAADSRVNKMLILFHQLSSSVVYSFIRSLRLFRPLLMLPPPPLFSGRTR